MLIGGVVTCITITLFIFLVLKYVVTMCMHFMFCANVIFLCGVFVVVECVLFILSGCCMLCKTVELVCGIL